MPSAAPGLGAPLPPLLQRNNGYTASSSRAVGEVALSRRGRSACRWLHSCASVDFRIRQDHGKPARAGSIRLTRSSTAGCLPAMAMSAQKARYNVAWRSLHSLVALAQTQQLISSLDSRRPTLTLVLHHATTLETQPGRQQRLSTSPYHAAGSLAAASTAGVHPSSAPPPPSCSGGRAHLCRLRGNTDQRSGGRP